MVGTLVDLFSIYKCPTTTIKAANTIVNKALANWWTWIIFPHPIKRFYVGRTPFRSIEFRPIGRRELGDDAARASILPATGSRTALRWLNIYPAIDLRCLHRFFVGQHLRHRVMPLGMIGFLLNGMIVLSKDRMPRPSRSSTAAFTMDGGRSTAALHRDSGRLT